MAAFHLTRLMLTFALAIPLVSSAQLSDDQRVLSEARALNKDRQYAKAIRVLQGGMQNSPSNLELKTELGKTYLYNRQDDQAAKVFEEVVAQDPDNLTANLEIARLLGYHRDYEASNRRYRQILAHHPDYEAAQTGLIRNLIHQKKYDEARTELASALRSNPQSSKLNKLKQKIDERPARKETKDRTSRVQISESFYSDSGGNRSLRSDQFAEYWFTSKISNRVQSQEKSLWSDTLSTSHVLWATDELKLLPTSFVGFVAGGGVVRFPDAQTRSLYRTALELYPRRNITVSGGFGRSTFSPTAQAALLDLTGEGWFARADGAP